VKKIVMKKESATGTAVDNSLWRGQADAGGDWIPQRVRRAKKGWMAWVWRLLGNERGFEYVNLQEEFIAQAYAKKLPIQSKPNEYFCKIGIGTIDFFKNGVRMGYLFLSSYTKIEMCAIIISWYAGEDVELLT